MREYSLDTEDEVDVIIERNERIEWLKGSYQTIEATRAFIARDDVKERDDPLELVAWLLDEFHSELKSRAKKWGIDK